MKKASEIGKVKNLQNKAYKIHYQTQNTQEYIKMTLQKIIITTLQLQIQNYLKKFKKD